MNALILSSRDLRTALDEAILTTLLEFFDDEDSTYLFPPGGLHGLLFGGQAEGNA